MSTLQTLPLDGRHIQQFRPLPLLLLLSTFLCLPEESASLNGCYDQDLNITRAHGEQWLLPNCGGVATCHGWRSSYTLSTCPEPAGCQRLDEGDPSATFPRCCPRIACTGCYSAELGRDFGSSWTEGHCVRRRCRLGPSGSVERYEDACEPLGPPPSLDCEVVGQDMSRGQYPLCCAYYRCPGLCRSGHTWQPVKEVTEDSCDKLRDSSASWLPWN